MFHSRKYSFCLLVLILVFCSPVWSNNVEQLFEKGQQAYKDGLYVEAIKYFERVVELSSGYAPVYNALGLAYKGNNAKLSDIVWYYKVAIDIDSQYAEAYYNMCQAYYDAGEHDQAEKSCLAALKINPAMGNAQLSLAWIYLLGKSQPADAIPYFQQVVKKAKKPIIYFGLGLAYAMKGDSAQVLDIITILRSMGEDQYASHLEKTIRQQIQQPLPTEIIIPERQHGHLVPASSEEAAPPMSPPSSSPVEGTMKIRLKGKLTNSEKEEKGHPGSLTQ